MYRNQKQTDEIIAKQARQNPVATIISALKLRFEIEGDASSYPDGMFAGEMNGETAAQWVASRALDHLIDECGDFLRDAAKHYREHLDNKGEKVTT